MASARKEVTAKREVKVELKKGDKRWDFLEMYSFKFTHWGSRTIAVPMPLAIIIFV